MGVTARQEDLLLAIDVGTGSVRAALFHRSGRMLALSARQHDQLVPRFGWAEQRPADWWDGAIESIRRVLETTEGASHRVSAIATCGQMHGVVLIDDNGQLVLDSVQLWNDKRPSEDVSAFVVAHDVDALWKIAANPPSVAWPGFKLRWIARHQPEALSRVASLLMPKDYVNFQLTGRWEWTTPTPPVRISGTREPAIGALSSLVVLASMWVCYRKFGQRTCSSEP
jgi:xylulokinase